MILRRRVKLLTYFKNTFRNLENYVCINQDIHINMIKWNKWNRCYIEQIGIKLPYIISYNEWVD